MLNELQYCPSRLKLYTMYTCTRTEHNMLNSLYAFSMLPGMCVLGSFNKAQEVHIHTNSIYHSFASDS